MATLLDDPTPIFISVSGSSILGLSKDTVIIGIPCIILDSKILRLVLEAFPKVFIFQHFFLDQNIQKGSNRVILKDLNFC